MAVLLCPESGYENGQNPSTCGQVLLFQIIHWQSPVSLCGRNSGSQSTQTLTGDRRWELPSSHKCLTGGAGSPVAATTLSLLIPACGKWWNLPALCPRLRESPWRNTALKDLTWYLALFPDPCWRSKELTSESVAGLTDMHVLAPPALNAKPALVECLCCSWELPCDVVQGHLYERVRETHRLQPLLLGGLLTVCKSVYSLSLSRKLWTFVVASSGPSLGAGWA